MRNRKLGRDGVPVKRKKPPAKYVAVNHPLPKTPTQGRFTDMLDDAQKRNRDWLLQRGEENAVLNAQKAKLTKTRKEG